MGMTNAETIAYFKEHNEALVIAAKDENVYDYEKKEIEAVCMREAFEANEKAIQALEQQTSEDCVSRNTLERAVSELTYWHPTTDGRLEVGGAFDNTVYKVEDVWRLTRVLPSVTPKTVTDFADKCQECGKIFNDKLQTKWIPVSERLPNVHEYIKNNGLFNVSDGNRSYFGWFDIYDTKRFVKPTIAGFRVDNAVIAWMPLPEPYNAESEVRNDYYF